MTQCSYKSNRPCASCPWRRDKHAEDIPGFVLDKAEGLASTCPDEQGLGPSYGAPWFAWHQSREGEEIPCSGWLATVWHCHPGVRLAITHGRLGIDALRPDPAWPDLHEDYQEVLEKLRTSETRAGEHDSVEQRS